ncbi:glycerophosphoryl diester phosphodiesterase membrane domain-containing protein [Sphingomicrobium flavum]|uniref:glycerophosphoryl diester phosphodiesterase membrane domain-containing protein n=1 Tax=Sphingomicrobium flavum TaxID=1229164 RepID=UPI0021ADA45D|nr:glycerophosphoryl diester phosphodiesterase membrane domain-containing protein [Sphingomicrobium flavum]
MAKLSITKAWDDSRPIIARDGRLMFAIALATVVVPGTLMYLMDPTQNQIGGDTAAADANGATVLISLLSSLIGMIGSIAISYLALTRGASVGDGLRRGLKRVLPTIGAVLLLLVPIVALAMMFIVVGLGAESLQRSPELTMEALTGPAVLMLFLMMVLIFYVAVRLLLMTPVIAAEDQGPLGILKRSWSITKGHGARLFGFLILFVVAAILVMAAAGIVVGLVVSLIFGEIEPMSIAALVTGLFATIVQAGFTIVWSTMVARIYLQLTGRSADPDANELREPRVSVPPSGEA